MGRGVFKRVIQGQGAANRSNTVRPSGLAASSGENENAVVADGVKATSNGRTEKTAAPKEPEKKEAAPAAENDLPRAMQGLHGNAPEIVNAAPPVLGADAAEESAASSRPKDDAHKREAAYSSNEPRDVTHDKPYQTKPYGFPVVYGDDEVCRVLKIRRRTIAAARTRLSRGVDWDCCGLHAGMTMKWIQEEALRRGIVPDFLGGALKPIRPDDGVVSCKMLGTWPNRSRVTAEVVATGEARIATVKSADMMHLYEIFDCRDYGSELVWTAELNNMVY